MRDVNAGDALAQPQIEEILHQQVARLRVERRQRLVHQQHGRAHHQRAGDADALAHAARELLRQRVGEIVELGALQRVARRARSRSPGGSLWCSSGRATFCATVRHGSSAKSWKI